MATIGQAVQQALANWQGVAPTCPPNVASTVFTLNPKKPARMGTGTQGNAAHWAGIVAVLQANGGKATGAQLLQGSIYGNPGNVGNAWPLLRYAINNRQYLVPAQAA